MKRYSMLVSAVLLVGILAAACAPGQASGALAKFVWSQPIKTLGTLISGPGVVLADSCNPGGFGVNLYDAAGRVTNIPAQQSDGGSLCADDSTVIHDGDMTYIPGSKTSGQTLVYAFAGRVLVWQTVLPVQASVVVSMVAKSGSLVILTSPRKGYDFYVTAWQLDLTTHTVGLLAQFSRNPEAVGYEPVLSIINNELVILYARFGVIGFSVTDLTAHSTRYYSLQQGPAVIGRDGVYSTTTEGGCLAVEKTGFDGSSQKIAVLPKEDCGDTAEAVLVGPTTVAVTTDVTGTNRHMLNVFSMAGKRQWGRELTIQYTLGIDSKDHLVLLTADFNQAFLDVYMATGEQIGYYTWDSGNGYAIGPNRVLQLDQGRAYVQVRNNAGTQLYCLAVQDVLPAYVQ